MKVVYFLLILIVGYKGAAQRLDGSFVSKFKRFQRGELFSGLPETTANLVAWRGERLHAQVLVWTTAPTAIDYSVSDLKKSTGETLNPTQVQLVTYVKGDPFPKECNGFPARTSFVEIADALSDDVQTFLSADDPLKLWLTINVDTAASPGMYYGKLIIRSATNDLELNLNVQVVDRLLPVVADWNFHLDLWQYPYQLLQHYNDAHPEHQIAVWSAEHMGLIKPLYTLLADMGQKAVTAHIKSGALGGPSMISWIRKSDGSWYYDYSGFDAYVQTLFSLGITKQINCFSPVGWNKNEIPFIDEVSGSLQTLSAPLTSELYRDRWNHFLTDFRNHLLTKGWFDRTVLYMDEVSEEEMNAVVSMIHAHNASWKIGLAYSHSISSSLQNQLYDRSGILELPTYLQANSNTTFYTSCTQLHPNNYVTTANSPAEMTWMGWFAKSKGMNGYLRWAYDYWKLSDPADARDGSNAAGDFSMVYRKDNNGAILGSIRASMLREGMQDTEKITILMNELTLQGNTQALESLVRMLQSISKQNTTMIEEQIMKAQQLLTNIATGQPETITASESAIQYESEEIAIYPNPTRNVLTIQLGSLRSGTISIYSSAGNLCKQTILKNSGGRMDWSIEELSPGIYWLVVNSDKHFAGQLFWKH